MNRLISLAAAAFLLTSSTAAMGLPQTYQGELYDRESHAHDMVLSGGRTYTYRGSCDRNCSDLDLALYEKVEPSGGRRGYWRFVIANRRRDGNPVIRETPRYSHEYRLSVIMSACGAASCDYDVNLSW
jgi:hypothetical protein